MSSKNLEILDITIKKGQKNKVQQEKKKNDIVQTQNEKKIGKFKSFLQKLTSCFGSKKQKQNKSKYNSEDEENKGKNNYQEDQKQSLLLQDSSKKIKKENLRSVDQNYTYESYNKIISDMLKYEFQYFKIIQTNYELEGQNELESSQTIQIQQKEWKKDHFNQENQNILSSNFIENKDLIFQELEKQKFFICKEFIRQENMDLFAGYQQNNGEKDCIFKIYYLPDLKKLEEEKKAIQKYDRAEQVHVKISENVHILVMSKKAFQILQNKFEIPPFRYWSKEFFNLINDEKFIQLNKGCQQCEACKKQQNCQSIRYLRKFQDQQNDILDKFIQRGIFLCEYVNEGGEGIIFNAYRMNQFKNEDFVVKILFDFDEKEVEKEIQTMKLFDKNINMNIIQFIDSFKIENLKIYVYILEKCKYSLLNELNMFSRHNEQFTESCLFKMIFDLLDGLKQLRIYKILHLDIKLSNILISNSGNYVYTDFGMSSIKQPNQEIEVKGGTKDYEPPEQKNRDPKIDFRADVYSLGQAFIKIIDCYKQFRPDDKLVEEIKDIIQKKMTKENKEERENCLELFEIFLLNLIKRNNKHEILNQQIEKIQKMLMLSSFDENKDIPFILDLKLYYNLKLLQLNIIQINHQNSVHINNPFESFSPQQIAQFIFQNSSKIDAQSIGFIIQQFNHIGICYFNTGCYQDSLEYFIQSLSLYRKIFTYEHHNIATYMNNTGCCFQHLGDYKKALRYTLESLYIRKQIFKNNHIYVAQSLNNVGKCYLDLRDYEKALKYLLKSYNMSKQINQKDDHNTALSLNNIGSCLQNLGKKNKALKFFEKSLKIHLQIFKQCHPLIVTSLNNVGQCYYDLGNQQMAQQYQQQSFEMCKQIYKINHPQFAQSLNNMNLNYQNNEDLDLQLQYLKDFQSLYKGNHPQIATQFFQIGLCYRNLGKKELALENSYKSLQMRKQIFIGNQNYENQLIIVQSLNMVGLCYFDLDNNKKALAYLLECLQIIKQIQKIDDANVAVSLSNVGNCYKKLGNNKKALKYLQKFLQMREKLFNDNHIDVAITLDDIGSCYRNLDQHEKALIYQLKSLNMKKQIFMKNHPSIAISLYNVSDCYQNLGDFYQSSKDIKKALLYQLEYLIMIKQVYKKNHPDIAEALNNIGVCYSSKGDHKKALEYELKSLQMREQIYQKNHPLVALSLNNVGTCYFYISSYKQALRYQLESLFIRKQIFKKDHSSIAKSHKNIGTCYLFLGKNEKAQQFLSKSDHMRNIHKI